jgi:Na+-translocating ferredoxin:NAD+ oxidoreductase RnfA subunit
MTFVEFLAVYAFGAAAGVAVVLVLLALWRARD